MANTKISALPAAAALSASDPFPTVQAGATVKATPAQMATYLAANGTLLSNITDTWTSGSTNFTYKSDTTISGGATGKLIEVQVGGSARFSVDNAGAGLFSTSLAVGGATIGTNALSVLGTTLLTGANNTTPLTITGGSITGAATTPFASLGGTWNTTGAPTALLINVTKTATNNFAKLFSAQVGGSEKFFIEEFGKTVGESLRAGVSLGYFSATNNYAQLRAANYFGWASSTNSEGTTDTLLNRVAAGIIGVRAGTTTAGGALGFVEQTAPSAPATDGVYIYAQDNGAGKTQLMARFATGAAVQIAIEP